MLNSVKEILAEIQKVGAEFSNNAEVSTGIAKAAEEILGSLKRGGKIIVFGNGGSAADSQHFACELVGRFKKERPPVPAVALTTNTSSLTAIGNDYGFEDVFARQVAALARKGDVAIAISTSGKSPNVLKAAEKANELGLLTIGLTGKDGARLKSVCKYCICVPAASTPRAQELHIKILHIIAELIETNLFR